MIAHACATLSSTMNRKSFFIHRTSTACREVNIRLAHSFQHLGDVPLQVALCHKRHIVVRQIDVASKLAYLYLATALRFKLAALLLGVPPTQPPNPLSKYLCHNLPFNSIINSPNSTVICPQIAPALCLYQQPP